MNITFLFGILMAGLLFMTGLVGEMSLTFFLDPHALIVVIGGTFTAALISIPLENHLRLLKGFFGTMLFGKQNGPSYLTRIAEDVIEASNVARADMGSLSNMRVTHPFLREGLRIIADGMLSEHELRELLYKRMEFYQHFHLEDARILHGLAKFPPAFGLLGAVTGMIAMMSKLSGGAESIGKSMAVALVATFWGILIANVILLPLSDYYKKFAEDDSLVRRAIVDGLLMIKRKESVHTVEEKMNSYLPPGKRMSGGGAKRTFRKAA